MSRFTLKQAGPLAYFVFSALESYDFLVHAFSMRRGGISPFPSGALNLAYLPEDTKENVDTNRARFLAALGREPLTPITLHQVHSSQIHILNKEASKTKSFLPLSDRNPPDPCRMGDGDGLVTDATGYGLGIQTADCFPIFLVDPKRRAIANLHAGWRGTHSRIVERGVEAMRSTYGSSPADLMAALGPGIGDCCYEVGEEVTEAFRREFSYVDEIIRRPAGAVRPHLDLAAANERQLRESGLGENQILQAHRCTACEPEWFFSYRRENGRTGRMMALIGLAR